MRRSTLSRLAFLALVLACSCARKSDSNAGLEQTASAAPQQGSGHAVKRALLIGIDKYRYPDVVPSLEGAVNDVEDIKSVLIGKFDFHPENILVLKDNQATHAGIVSAIQNHLIAKAQLDDIVVIQYSGHGSQMVDPTGKMISGLDETLVPHDSRDPEGKVFDISGAEMHPLLVQLSAKTKNITFILDSCHSGSLVKAVGSRVRSIPPDQRRPPALPATGTRGLDHSIGATGGYAVIAAATSSEVAFEYYADRKHHGALSYFLARQLRTVRAGATYRDVMDPVIASVNSNYSLQHPQLEGAQADQAVFGDSTSIAQAYVPVSAADKSHVTLSAGEVQGLTVGSVFDIYAPGTKQFDASQKPSGKVKISAVQAFTADVKYISGTAQLGSRAVEREHQYGTHKVRVYVDASKSPELQKLIPALQNYKQIEIARDSRSCNIQLSQRGKEIQILAADGRPLSPKVPASSADMVEKQINQWSKWFNVLWISNPAPTLTVEFTLTAGGVNRSPLMSMTRPDAAIKAGDTIKCTVKNSSDRPLYLSILDLSEDGSISVAYGRRTSPVLNPGLSVGVELKTFVPEGRTAIQDVLKLFAAVQPIDLTPLEQSGIKSPEEDPIGMLLGDAAGTKGVEPIVKPGEWVTGQRLLLIRK